MLVVRPQPGQAVTLGENEQEEICAGAVDDVQPVRGERMDREGVVRGVLPQITAFEIA